MTAADPISVGAWASRPEVAVPDSDAEVYVGRHRRPGIAPFTLRRLFYLARHRRR